MRVSKRASSHRPVNGDKLFIVGEKGLCSSFTSPIRQWKFVEWRKVFSPLDKSPQQQILSLEKEKRFSLIVAKVTKWKRFFFSLRNNEFSYSSKNAKWISDCEREDLPLDECFSHRSTTKHLKNRKSVLFDPLERRLVVCEDKSVDRWSDCSAA